MDWLANVFLGAFAFGLLFSLGSAVLGAGHFGVDHGGPELGVHGADAADPSGGEHAGATGHPTGPSPFNLTALAAFVTWFGGVGYLALVNLQLALVLSLGLAFLAGILGWSVIFFFLRKLIYQSRGRLNLVDSDLAGTVARVSVPILPGRIGEVQFTRAGSRRSEGARSLEGTSIERGAEVVIVRYERGIAYVQPWGAYLAKEAVEH